MQQPCAEPDAQLRYLDVHLELPGTCTPGRLPVAGKLLDLLPKMMAAVELQSDCPKSALPCPACQDQQHVGLVAS